MIIDDVQNIKKSKINEIIFENKNNENNESSNCDVNDEKINCRKVSKNIERCFWTRKTTNSNDKFSSLRLKNRLLIVMKKIL